MGIQIMGLDYFPMNVDFFEDDKIELIEAEFGIKGSILAVKLLCKIYKEGYFYKWGEDECLLFSKKAGAEFVPGFVKEVVNGLVRRCFFDKGCFDSFGILTSSGIQRRYFEAAKRRKRIDVNPDFLLIDVSDFKNVYISGKNVCINNENVNIQGQSKVKYSKEKESKEIPPLSPTGGSGGGSFFNLSRNDPPPSDGVKRNYEALTRELTNFKLSPDEFNTICELSNYGEIGNPVWKLLQRIRDSREGKYKIDHPGRFLISRLKNND